VRRVPVAIKIAVPVLSALFLVAALVIGVGILKAWWSLPFTAVQVTATQPIQFPHDVHASAPRTVVADEKAVTDPATQIALEDARKVRPAAEIGETVGLGIDCLFCHRTANSDEAASIPSVQQCYACHQVVKKDSPEIAKITYAFENNEPINWVRVHRLPDHVQFTHQAHIKFFSEQMNVAPSQVCSVCHGDVKSMKVAEQVRNLKMRDCVDCHRSGFLSYLTEESRETVKQAIREGRMAAPPTDCWACHY